MEDITELYGSRVFNDKVMKSCLPSQTYEALRTTIDNGGELTLEVANIVASAMRDWAVKNGATHFTHWFQPMTGVTAEKHDSFVSPLGDGGAIMGFSGKALVKGEPDASSFPSGGIRATFEARGYTAWDATSPAFIKDRTLCIPTAFYSYSGEALDKKTPLLRSMEAVNKQAKRILKLFGEDVKNVYTTVGSEQEYFLVDKKVYEKRPDLMICGRTLFGARAPKGQELEDHYFGAIKSKVSEFMKDLDEELWKLGIPAKTEHNEVAPAQHELAPLFENCNLATDHNQLTMELMRLVANRHDLVCLLHEKPFAGVNGSGKHNNWSLCTDSGVNLLEPGATPAQNARFLTFLIAVISAVDDYQDLLRVSAASAGNDHRLGANEAPPAIVSVFLGDELEGIMRALETETPYEGKIPEVIKLGVTTLPQMAKDTTDRNRTSPFAFTGNKFEFRMLGSNFSVAGPNIILNTIVADELSDMADELENSNDFNGDLTRIIREKYIKHKRIVFNGNNYTEEWKKEAAARGLMNLPTTVDALPHFIADKNIKLFTKYGVFSEVELRSRYEILLENYNKTLNIEALTAVDMVNKCVIPSVIAFENELLSVVTKKAEMKIDNSIEKSLVEKITELVKGVMKDMSDLSKSVEADHNIEDEYKRAEYIRDNVVRILESMRVKIDDLERVVAKKYWPYPSYRDLLYSVKY